MFNDPPPQPKIKKNNKEIIIVEVKVLTHKLNKVKYLFKFIVQKRLYLLLQKSVFSNLFFVKELFGENN